LIALLVFGIRSLRQRPSGLDAKPTKTPTLDAQAARVSPASVAVRIVNRAPKPVQRIRVTLTRADARKATITPGDHRKMAAFDVARPLMPGDELVVTLALPAPLQGPAPLRGAVVGSSGAHVRFDVVDPPDSNDVDGTRPAGRLRFDVAAAPAPSAEPDPDATPVPPGERAPAGE
jgi:hypothetical protein